MILIENRKAQGAVFLKPGELNNPESVALYGAKELRYYIGRMSTALLDFKEACEGAGYGIYLEQVSDETLGSDGFCILSDEKKVLIRGGRRGLLYGVYELLERLGCRFFTSTCERIPTLPTLDIPSFETTQVPKLEYREHNYTEPVKNPRFAVRCRLNGAHHGIPERMGGNMSYAWFVHTFEYMVPTAVYGRTHPEYFAMVNGERKILDEGRTQLCLSNPEVLTLCTEAVRKRLRERPEARIISVSQNDWHESCQCPACRKTDLEEGSPAGTLLRFVNSIAEALEPEFPDVIFDTLSYQYTRPAPRLTGNRKNVCVRLCSIECCFSHPFETCDDESRMVTRPDGSKGRFIDDLEDWGRICDRMYIWDYTTCFAHYATPHPNWRVLQPNIQAMVRNHARGIFEQGNGSSKGGVDFNELRAYLISRLLWDPDCDLARHRREFMEEFYGAAAPALNEYLDLLCDTVEKEHCHVGFNDNPTHSFLREEMLDRYDRLFDRAAEAVKGDPIRLYRVEKNRLSIRWVRLKRKTMLHHEFDPEEINRFFADWRGFDLAREEEWFNIETTFRALLDENWRGIDYFGHWIGEEEELF